MMAVHLPVPLVFLLRIISGFSWMTIPLLMLSFGTGQFIGGNIRNVFRSDGGKNSTITISSYRQSLQVKLVLGFLN